MTIPAWLLQHATLWLIAAAALAGLELAIPGLYLVFVAIAAAITGMIAFAFPGFPLALQWISFAIWTAVWVAIGKRWSVPTTEPLLNDRAAQLIGQEVTVTEAIQNGRGRVRVGDGEWIARGPDCDVGSQVRIVGGQSVLEVEPIETEHRIGHTESLTQPIGS